MNNKDHYDDTFYASIPSLFLNLFALMVSSLVLKLSFNNSISKKTKIKNLIGVLPLDLHTTNYINRGSKLHKIHN